MAAIAKEGGYLLARNPMEMVSSVFFYIAYCYIANCFIAAHMVVHLHLSTAVPCHILLVTLQACVQTFFCIQ